MVVEAGRRDERARLQVEDSEGQTTHGAARDRLVLGQAGPRVLQVEVVLVGPEPGNLAVGLVLSGHRVPDDEALTLCGLKVLDPNPRLEQRMKEPGDVSRSEHALGRSSSQLVDDDSLIDRQTGPLSELRPWDGADRNQVGGRRRSDLQPKIDTPLAMQSSDVRADLWTEHPQQRLSERLVDADLASLVSCHRRDLASDEPGAGDVERFNAVEHRAQPIRGRELAQVERVLEARQPPGIRTGADAQQVPTDRLAACEQNPSFRDAEVEHSIAKLEVDSQLVVLRGWAQAKAVARHRARQVALAQVRTLVRQLAFGTDQRDPALVTCIAESSRHSVARRARSDDY